MVRPFPPPPPPPQSSRNPRVFKVARTYLYARWLCFLIAFFGRKDLTDFYEIAIPYKEWSNFKKLQLFVVLQALKRLRYRYMLKTAFIQKMSVISKP